MSFLVNAITNIIGMVGKTFTMLTILSMVKTTFITFNVIRWFKPLITRLIAPFIKYLQGDNQDIFKNNLVLKILRDNILSIILVRNQLKDLIINNFIILISVMIFIILLFLFIINGLLSYITMIIVSNQIISFWFIYMLYNEKDIFQELKIYFSLFVKGVYNSIIFILEL
jgi:hypothetical protein